MSMQRAQGMLLFLVRFNNSTRFEIYGVTRSSSSRPFLCALAICKDVVSYALLISLFACLVFNTGEDLYCAHVWVRTSPDSRPTTFKHRLKSNLPLRCKNLTRGACPQHPLTKNKTKQRVHAQCPGVVCDLATPLNIRIVETRFV